MCGCTNKISRNMKRGRKKITFSVNSVKEQTPLLVGGAAALAANPIVDPFLGGNPWIASIAKAAVGLLALSTGNRIAVGFGTVMAAYGTGQLINAASNQFLKKEIPGLPSVAGLPWASFDYAVAGVHGPDRYTHTPSESIAVI